jgi:transketolase N-terminal domain/subunit/transketolase C-terminal domain/subunit
MTALARLAEEQNRRNAALVADTPLAGQRIESHVLPFALDLDADTLAADQDVLLSALEKTAATLAIKSLISLAKAGDIDHLGGGLELIPALLMTLGITDYTRRHYAIEHGHTSIGYYAALSTLGFLPESRVVESFRRSLDIAGHVSWVPGGTPIGSGRLGVAVPVAAGLALGLKARHGDDAFVVCHCGDAGWISGQALNGFIAASLHKAPIAFVMHRNGIQLSGTTRRIMDKDPRPIVSSLGVEVLEIPSLHERSRLFMAYAEAYRRAKAGRSTLIYPVGYGERDAATVRSFGEMYGIVKDVSELAAKHHVSLDTRIHVPGSLMSFRDADAMTECVFYVNELPGGEAHHDGGMKGRNGEAILAGTMLGLTDGEQARLRRLEQQPRRTVVTGARPPQGAPNLLLTNDDVNGIQLPGTDKWITARAGSEAAYVAIAKKHKDRCFFISADLNPSTKLGKAADLVPVTHRFEMSIQEQASTLLADGLSMAGSGPQLTAFSTFAAFMEGIAREGLEMWRYQRNLTGPNEGLNVLLHFSHVGACTGRDHFSGWSLDWVNMGIAYLPYLHRFYAPCDARAAFLAVRDAAAAFGGHIVAIPRDNLPVLTRQDSNEPLWDVQDPWTPLTPFRHDPAAEVAVLTLGAPSYLAGAAWERAQAGGVGADVYIVNGFPLPENFLAGLTQRYKRVVTVEDGLIGTPGSGLRGFAGMVATGLCGSEMTLEHVGIVDPSVAPSDHFVEVWKHYGITEEAIAESITGREG